MNGINIEINEKGCEVKYFDTDSVMFIPNNGMKNSDNNFDDKIFPTTFGKKKYVPFKP